MDYDTRRIGPLIVARGFEGEEVYAEIESPAARLGEKSSEVVDVVRSKR